MLTIRHVARKLGQVANTAGLRACLPEVPSKQAGREGGFLVGPVAACVLPGILQCNETIVFFYSGQWTGFAGRRAVREGVDGHRRLQWVRLRSRLG